MTVVSVTVVFVRVLMGLVMVMMPDVMRKRISTIVHAARFAVLDFVNGEPLTSACVGGDRYVIVGRYCDYQCVALLLI